MPSSDDTHECPVNGCTVLVTPRMLMCRSHWRQVPRPIQREVYAAWNYGAGAGTPEHRRAMRMAIDAVGRTGLAGVQP